MKGFFRSIGYGLRNLYRWFPVIWCDRDWDWAYLYQIIEVKLHYMSRLQREHGVCVNAGHLAGEMEEAAELLRSIREDDYIYESGYAGHLTKLQADLDRFAELFRTRSLGWWD